ncbi:MAG: tripartite tricarboxylate transporter substrate-binding protein [Reyranella sp.]|uniref:tripartite tricarboxylate transporter substrate-binding protein n=1 Tax=Reyranella sp. TaxID=1929291 RepID=UPI003D0D7A73
MPCAQSGRLSLLAVTSKERSAMLPDIPTMAEAGFPEIAITQWFAAFAPAGTPGEIARAPRGGLRQGPVRSDGARAPCGCCAGDRGRHTGRILASTYRGRRRVVAAGAGFGLGRN